jgi:hypothetical protein
MLYFLESSQNTRPENSDTELDGMLESATIEQSYNRGASPQVPLLADHIPEPATASSQDTLVLPPSSYFCYPFQVTNSEQVTSDVEHANLLESNTATLLDILDCDLEQSRKHVTEQTSTTLEPVSFKMGLNRQLSLNSVDFPDILLQCDQSSSQHESSDMTMLDYDFLISPSHLESAEHIDLFEESSDDLEMDLEFD